MCLLTLPDWHWTTPRSHSRYDGTHLKAACIHPLRIPAVQRSALLSAAGRDTTIVKGTHGECLGRINILHIQERDLFSRLSGSGCSAGQDIIRSLGIMT